MPETDLAVREDIALVYEVLIDRVSTVRIVK